MIPRTAVATLTMGPRDEHFGIRTISGPLAGRSARLQRHASVFLIVAAFSGAVALSAARARAEVTGYERFSDWIGWARLDAGVRAGLASSYDRTGGNADYCWYESPLGLQYAPGICTVRTLTGPGVIQRFWMPHFTANHHFIVRMYFDGEVTPRIDTTSNALLGGAFGYFAAPFVDTFAGGQYSMEPIPFAQSVRIETDNQVLPDQTLVRHYYQYGFSTYPAGTPISTFSGVLSPVAQSERVAAAAILNAAGQHPDPGLGSDVLTGPQSIAAGQSLVLAELVGPGVVRRVCTWMPAATDDDLSALRLVIRYDGADVAIDVSVGEFFGAGRGRAAYRSLPIGTIGPDGYYSFWPMPFRRSVRIELRNDGGSDVPVAAARVEWQPIAWSHDLCYLRAEARTTVRGPDDEYHTLLNAAGRGHYVGNLLYVAQDFGGLTMLEGDDLVLVDGEPLSGTGAEDAYNGGYFYNWTKVQYDEPEGPSPRSATRPLCGALFVHRDGALGHGRADQYRWYIADRIGFSSAIDVKIECSYGQVGSIWRSVVFWYQQPAIAADVNDDGVVDALDSALFLEAILGLPVHPGIVARCDLNGGGRADGEDIALFVASAIP